MFYLFAKVNYVMTIKHSLVIVSRHNYCNLNCLSIISACGTLNFALPCGVYENLNIKHKSPLEFKWSFYFELNEIQLGFYAIKIFFE